MKQPLRGAICFSLSPFHQVRLIWIQLWGASFTDDNPQAKLDEVVESKSPKYKSNVSFLAKSSGHGLPLAPPHADAVILH